MKRVMLIFVALFVFGFSPAESHSDKILILITEQNIAGPQSAWWSEGKNFSAAEAVIAQQLKEGGYTVTEPSNIDKIVRKRRAYRLLPLTESRAVRLARLAKSDYVLLGQAAASAGLSVPESRARSYFGNITARFIRVRDGEIILALDASGNSVHSDAASGAKDALMDAGKTMSRKLLDFLSKGDE